MAQGEPPTTHWPTYALRAWLTALLGQMERAGGDLEKRVEYHEQEIARLRAQMHRSSTVVTALREAIASVDDVLRRTRDSEAEQRRGESRGRSSESSAELAGEPEKTPPSSEEPRSPERRK
jgi:septal ring factor EnvC (AmiA/AmiB activator)